MPNSLTRPAVALSVIFSHSALVKRTQPTTILFDHLTFNSNGRVDLGRIRRPQTFSSRDRSPAITSTSFTKRLESICISVINVMARYGVSRQPVGVAAGCSGRQHLAQIRPRRCAHMSNRQRQQISSYSMDIGRRSLWPVPKTQRVAELSLSP